MTDQLSLCGLTLGAMLLLANGGPLRAQGTAPPFRVCKGTYALCTKAKCVDKGDSFFACKCDVIQGSSAGSGTQACAWVPTVNPPVAGSWIPSRYHPIKSYVQCPISKPAEPRAWAFCLDSPCVVDKNKTTAECLCGKANGAPYVFTTDKYNPAGCEENISSATVDAVNQITEFLKATPPVVLEAQK
jgi:hypothetical protein